MSAPYPYFNGTSILSLVEYVNNDLTNGLFLTLALFAFPVIIFAAMKQNNVSTPRAYAVSIFMLALVFFTFVWSGLINADTGSFRVYLVVIVLLVTVGFALKGSETQFD